MLISQLFNEKEFQDVQNYFSQKTDAQKQEMWKTVAIMMKSNVNGEAIRQYIQQFLRS